MEDFSLNTKTENSAEKSMTGKRNLQNEFDKLGSPRNN